MIKAINGTKKKFSPIPDFEWVLLVGATAEEERESQ